MTADQSNRVASLVAEFRASKQRVIDYRLKENHHRRDIVLELLTFMSHYEAARVLGVTRTRIGQIAGGAE